MSTSGTYNFNPGLGEVSLFAYQLIGIRPTAILQEHVDAARTATNMMFTRWSNQGVNLWTVRFQTITLVQGTPSYTVPTNAVVMLDAYITTGSGNQAIDRIIMPVSRTEYMSYPNKAQQGFPTTFWFDRQLSPPLPFGPSLTARRRL